MTREKVIVSQRITLKLPSSIFKIKCFLMKCIIQLQQILSPDLIEAKGLCTWVRATPSTNTGRGMKGLRAALQRRTWMKNGT